MRPNLINRLKEEWNNLDPVDPLRGLIADAIDALVEAQPSKPWVGLTDEEMRQLEKEFNAERVRTSDEEYLIIYPGDYWAWQRAIEAKLREKNA